MSLKQNKTKLFQPITNIEDDDLQRDVVVVRIPVRAGGGPGARH